MSVITSLWLSLSDLNFLDAKWDRPLRREVRPDFLHFDFRSSPSSS